MTTDTIVPRTRAAKLFQRNGLPMIRRLSESVAAGYSLSLSLFLDGRRLLGALDGDKDQCPFLSGRELEGDCLEISAGKPKPSAFAAAGGTASRARIHECSHGRFAYTRTMWIPSVGELTLIACTRCHSPCS